MAEQQPMDLQALCYETAEDRQSLAALVCEEGVVDVPAGDLLVTTGANNLDLIVAFGGAYIEGDDDAPDQGMYRVRNDAATTLVGLSTHGVQAADAANPRIDQVVATVRDGEYLGLDNDWILDVVEGTPTVGATLANLTGAAVLPNNTIRLAYILVPATFTGPFVNVTHILDARKSYKSCGDSGLIATIPYTANGTFVKADYPQAKSIRVRAVGGGGGGGASAAAGAGVAAAGVGGSAGGYAESRIPIASLAASETVTVGTGGTGSGASGSPGNNGNPSSLGAHVVAGGGVGGTSSGAAVANLIRSGVTGGIGTTGQILLRGGSSGQAFSIGGALGAGGFGGSSELGAGAAGPTSNAAGNNASGRGGGGSGGGTNASQAANTGGDGQAGMVIIEVFG